MSLAQDEILMREYDSVVKQIIHWDSHFWHKSQFFLAIQSVFVIGAFKVLMEQISSSFGKPFILLFGIVTIFNIFLCYVWFRTSRRSREFITHRMERARNIEADERLQDVLQTFRFGDQKNLPEHRSAEWEVSIPIVFIGVWIALLIFVIYKFFVCRGG